MSAPLQPSLAGAPTPFRPVRVVLAVLAALLAISAASRWYAREVSLPRYCAEPGLARERLATIIGGGAPLGGEARREHLVAAKLLFLVPRASDEPEEAYLRRVVDALRAACRR